MLALVAFNFLLVFVISDAAGRTGAPQELEPPGSAEARFGANHSDETVHLVGATAALVMGVSGLVGLLVRPQRAGSATHVAMAAAAWLLTAVVVGDPDNHGGQAGAIDAVFVMLAVPALITALIAAPWRAGRRGPPRTQLLVAALVGLPGCWRVAAITAAGSAITIAAVSLVVPDAASALPVPWAVGALSWGISVLALTWFTSRSEPR